MLMWWLSPSSGKFYIASFFEFLQNKKSCHQTEQVLSGYFQIPFHSYTPHLIIKTKQGTGTEQQLDYIQWQASHKKKINEINTRL